MKLSEKILKFHYFFKAFVAYITAHFAELQVSVEQKDDLVTDIADWDPKFMDYTTPDTHGSASISDINDAYNAFYPVTENIKTAIRDNTNIVLSGADLVNLDIKRRKANNSSINPPKFAPSLAMVSNQHLAVDFFAFDPLHPTKKAKPDGGALLGYKIVFTAADAIPPLLKDYVVQVPSGKTLFDVIFGLDKVGMRMWIIAWYISPTGKTSPESVAISVLLV